MPIFTFPDEPVWNAETRTLIFTVEVGEYRGEVRVPGRLFRSLGGDASEAGALGSFFVNRTLFERATELRISRRALDDDGHLTLTAGDVAAAAARQDRTSLT